MCTQSPVPPKTNLLNQNFPSLNNDSDDIEQASTATRDRRLLRQVAAGDEWAFGKLYQRHSTPLYNYLLRLVRDAAVAEDLLQEVFVAAWLGADRFRERAKVTTWLGSVRPASGLDDLPELPAEDDPGALAMGTWRADQLRRALDQLSPKHRAVLELAFYHGLSHAEVAEIVGCPVGTVKSRMSYARRYLDEALKALGVEDY